MFLKVCEWLSRFEIIFWDLDGVLVDSLELKGAAMASAFADCLSLDPSVVKQFHIENPGLSRFAKAAYFCEQRFGYVDESIVQLCVQHYQERYDATVQYDLSHALPPLLAMKRCRDLTRKNFLVTNNPISGFAPWFGKVLEPDDFSGIFFGSDQKHEAIETVLHDSGISRERCLMVGDTDVDCAAAQKAKVRFLRVVSKMDVGQNFSFYWDQIEGERVWMI